MCNGVPGRGRVELLEQRQQPVDTLAAGDGFHGALALGLAEGRPIDEAARFACHAASLKCTRFGGRLGCPTRDEVLASLSRG
jgi:sulfofructose kinase